ncbi:uncharacterized protein [Oscarella lobularis]|uniref:uncharacterized protein isoform X2 n=1 Tax=Oscarella lobularis TaxID=121494 RepID=UPI00331392E7
MHPGNRRGKVDLYNKLSIGTPFVDGGLFFRNALLGADIFKEKYYGGLGGCVAVYAFQPFAVAQKPNGCVALSKPGSPPSSCECSSSTTETAAASKIKSRGPGSTEPSKGTLTYCFIVSTSNDNGRKDQHASSAGITPGNGIPGKKSARHAANLFIAYVPAEG